MAFRMPSPRPPRPDRPTPGKMNLFVVNPVFQNWCQDDGEKDKAALVASRVGEHRVHKNFGPQRGNWNLPQEQLNITTRNVDYGMYNKNIGPSKDKWDLPDDQSNIKGRDVDFTESKVFSTNRIFLLLMVLICLVSIAALVLTVMVVFGKIGKRCECSETKGK